MKDYLESLSARYAGAKQTWSVLAKNIQGQRHRHFQDCALIADSEDALVFWSPSGANVRNFKAGLEANLWQVKDSAILVFPKKRLFNYTLMLKERGPVYYVNLSSTPSCSPEQVVEYVDYHLDLARNAGGAVKLLDGDEFQQAIDRGFYETELVQQVRKAADEAQQALAELKGVFSKEFLEEQLESA